MSSSPRRSHSTGSISPGPTRLRNAAKRQLLLSKLNTHRSTAAASAQWSSSQPNLPLSLHYDYYPPPTLIDTAPTTSTPPRTTASAPARTPTPAPLTRAATHSSRTSRATSKLSRSHSASAERRMERLERAEHSKKAFIKQWVRSVWAARDAREGAESTSDILGGGGGGGGGESDGHGGGGEDDEEVKVVGRVLNTTTTTTTTAAAAAATTTTTTTTTTAAIKNSRSPRTSGVRHLNLRESGYTAADEKMFLVSSLVLRHPHSHPHQHQHQHQHQQPRIHVGPVEPIEIDLIPSSGSGSAASSPPADVIMISGSDVEDGVEGYDDEEEDDNDGEEGEVREVVMGEVVKVEESGDWEDEVEEIEPPPHPPPVPPHHRHHHHRHQQRQQQQQQQQQPAVGLAAAAARRRAFVRARLRSTGMKVLKAFGI